MKIINFDKMGSTDKYSLELVWIAYNQSTKGLQEIFEIGYNLNSGYVYIALENGVSIASCFGDTVDYIVSDYKDGTEYFLDTYEEAVEKLKETYEKV
tara:strand:- start:55 stop:345 length:291 start_codon:yes stop_codon:yes gene_type:complete